MKTRKRKSMTSNAAGMLVSALSGGDVSCHRLLFCCLASRLKSRFRLKYRKMPTQLLHRLFDACLCQINQIDMKYNSPTRGEEVAPAQLPLRPPPPIPS